MKAYQAIHAMLHALCLHRQDLPHAPSLVQVVDEPRWMGRNLPGVLALSRNLGVSYWLAHQHNEQWSDIGLRGLGDQLRALTNLQIGFRPTSFEEAEDEVLHTTEMQPDGLVQRFWASGSSDSNSSSSTISRSWAQALRYSEYDDYDGLSRSTGEGESSVSGSVCSTSEHEVVNVVGWEQVKYDAQSRLRRPRFTGVVRYEGWGTEVAFAPPPVAPSVLFGVPILALFRRAHDASWRDRTLPRSSYDPDLRLDGWTEREEARSRAASEDRPTHVGPMPPPSPGVRGQTASPSTSRDMRTPASPPAFDLPRGARTDGARKRRRRPKRGGAPHA